MTNETERPVYEGRRDSRTGEMLPPVGFEREYGVPASEFDSERWLKDNGFAHEKSKKKVARRVTAENWANRPAINAERDADFSVKTATGTMK